jgi:hypothetical protein
MMRKSHFCLVPAGKWGGYGSRDVWAWPVGCRPFYVQSKVIKPFEELVPLHTYGALSAEESQVAEIPRMVEEEMQRWDTNSHGKERFCFCKAMQWPWVYNDWENVSFDIDSNNAWATLMTLLHRRMHAYGSLSNVCMLM